MQKILETAGFLVALVGVSGAIDHLWVQPIMGFLNVLNRFVFPGLVPGYELYANLAVAAVGIVVMVVAEPLSRARG